jgi:hypothetical protein
MKAITRLRRPGGERAGASSPCFRFFGKEQYGVADGPRPQEHS